MLITNPVDVMLMSGDSFCLHSSFVNPSCRMPHLLVQSSCFTVEATFVVALLLAILPVFEAVMRYLLSASHLYNESSLLP